MRIEKAAVTLLRWRTIVERAAQILTENGESNAEMPGEKDFSERNLSTLYTTFYFMLYKFYKFFYKL